MLRTVKVLVVKTKQPKQAIHLSIKKSKINYYWERVKYTIKQNIRVRNGPLNIKMLHTGPSSCIQILIATSSWIDLKKEIYTHYFETRSDSQHIRPAADHRTIYCWICPTKNLKKAIQMLAFGLCKESMYNSCLYNSEMKYKETIDIYTLN